MALATINPATGKTVRTFEPLSSARLEAKLALAEATFHRHRFDGFSLRKKGMLAAAEIFENEQDRLGSLMTLEMGKPIRQARAEAAKCATACRFYAEHAESFLADEPAKIADGRGFIRYDPLGIVLAIMPWNFPFWQAVRFAAPALMAGNIGLLKHAANVPQCGLALEDVFLRAGFPEGSFQYLAIESKTVQRVIEDRRIAAVTLTGSVAAGAAVASIAGREIKRTVLELGGSDPFIVMPSAPLTKTVETAVKARTQNNGQSCIAAKRFLVHASVYDEFEKLFIAAFQKLRVGDPMLPETDMGPLAQAQSVETLEKQIDFACRSGARVLTGGHRIPGPGFYFEPTILADAPIDGPFVEEELFGPVALLFRVRDLDEAIKIANGTPYGLGACIWTQDSAEQECAIRYLQSGQVFVNSMVASQPALPFGGIKHSGYGRELGAVGIREFMNAKSVLIAGK
ncbi:MAG: aldehyde dehydrogenase family protein [Methylacidiphilales bacterium]|nr:aldehyde dehydrogenase family protein [Candidatus Methylacidiphilales bacterium]